MPFDGKKRIVVKVGTSTLTYEDCAPNFRNLDALARALSDLHHMGWEVILVSSGAIAVGTWKLKMDGKPQELRLKQAAAAAGQCELMHLYDKFFGEYGQTVAQILLTADDIGNEGVKENLLNTFNSLLELGVIPVVNENDSVSFAEIEAEGRGHKLFGDNDTLSAEVAVLCGADILVLLSDIDGLYEGNPSEDASARLIREVRVIDEDIFSMASGAGSRRGTGGMITKLNAAQLATENGIDMVITNGARPDGLYGIVEGQPLGTLFTGRRSKHDRA